MSPVRHSECTRHSTSVPSPISPLIRATWCSPFSRLINPYARNSPYLVGILVLVTHCTNLSFRLRYSCKSLIVINGISHCSASLRSSLVRIIVPSSFIISQQSPISLSPASLIKSTVASVCPLRSKTPFFLARRGNICPGRLNSSGRTSSSNAFIAVTERSKAEIPVVVSIWSMDTVNAVS